MSVVTGILFPRFIIRNAQGVWLEQIDLDLCNVPGMIEGYSREGEIIHRVKKKGKLFKLFNNPEGNTRITFRLTYRLYSLDENSLKLQKILEHEENGNQIQLLPNADNLFRIFKVVYSGEDYNLGRLKNASANNLIEMAWTTEELTNPNWQKVDTSVWVGDYIMDVGGVFEEEP